MSKALCAYDDDGDDDEAVHFRNYLLSVFAIEHRTGDRSRSNSPIRL